jgi:hypothetical protein
MILESLAKSQTAAHREVTRAKALCMDGKSQIQALDRT